MCKSIQFLSLLLLLLIPFSRADAQLFPSDVYGRVLDRDTGDGIPGVHVYLSGTRKGTVSDGSGDFHIEGIRPGYYQIVSTSIGFQKEVIDISVSKSDSLFLEIGMKPVVYAIDSITVEAIANKDWNRNFRRFKEFFLGRTPNATKCEIQNPYTLDFSTTPLSLEARAKEPLIIENKALGYQIIFNLTHFHSNEHGFRFSGEPFFELMEASRSRESRRWKEARQKAYTGSFLHFLRASAKGIAFEEGFKTYIFDRSRWRSAPSVFRNRVIRMDAGVELGDLISEKENGFEYTLDFDGFLHILFEEERADRDFMHDMQMGYKNNAAPQISVLESTEGPITFNEAGYLNSVYGVARYGYWNWESGVCDLLPYDFDEDENERASQ